MNYGNTFVREDNEIIALQQLIARIRALVAPVLATPEAPVPEELTAALFEFHIAAKSLHCLEDAAESARSLASLLHQCSARAPDEQERVQISVLIGNLMRELAPDVVQSLPAAPRPLVTPIAPSSATVNRRIALYVDSGAMLVVLRETLTQAGFLPEAVDSLETLAACDDANRPAAIIADLGLCELNPLSTAVFATLRRRFSPPPHLFCVAASDDIPARLQAVRLGATRFLAQPLDTARLVAILKGVTVQTPPEPFRVAMVEDDPFLSEVYREGLSEAGIEVCPILDPLVAPARIAEFRPDLIVSDLFMPGCNGFELLSLLRQDDALADTPILLLSSEPDVARRLEALNLGADDFLTKPVDISLLVATVAARARRARMLKRSRSEYRRLLQRVREMEAYLPENCPGRAEEPAVELDDMLFTETINMDDYVVREEGDDEKKLS